ncbi:MAG: TAXI family TRAP transporter solute-binding subunit [Desulfurococcales archaeon]|nr:TAXI family TRAP transporter solute-binding subunit [Desulfurococcales archaeon]
MANRTMLLASIIVLVVIVIAAVILLGGGMTRQTTTTTETTPQQETTPAPSKITVKWGTSRTGSSGYKALSTLASLASQKLDWLEIDVVPTAGAVASMKGFANGELDAAYAADIGFREMYQSTGRFEGFEPKRMLYQTLWVYTIDIGIAVPKDKAGQFTCWKDFDGQKIFTLPMGWDTGTALRLALDTLGVKYEHVELDLDAVATALQRGDIIGTGVYITGGRSLPSWLQQVVARVDLVVINPCDDEINVLRNSGIPLGESPTSPAFPKDVGVDKLVGVRIYYGFHTGTNLDEDTVYRLIKFVEENADELAKIDAAYSQIAGGNFLDFQVEAANAASFVPLHPGLAKYFKENNVWNDEWKVGT